MLKVMQDLNISEQVYMFVNHEVKRYHKLKESKK